MGSTAATQQLDAHKDHDEKDGRGHGPEAKEGVVAMTEERVTAAKIGVVPVAAGDLSRRLSVPATVMADRDRIVNDDHIHILLDTFNDGRTATVFGVNPNGVQ